jgi:hypothetical protein
MHAWLPGAKQTPVAPHFVGLHSVTAPAVGGVQVALSSPHWPDGLTATSAVAFAPKNRSVGVQPMSDDGETTVPVVQSVSFNPNCSNVTVHESTGRQLQPVQVFVIGAMASVTWNVPALQVVAPVSKVTGPPQPGSGASQISHPPPSPLLELVVGAPPVDAPPADAPPADAPPAELPPFAPPPG